MASHSLRRLTSRVRSTAALVLRQLRTVRAVAAPAGALLRSFPARSAEPSRPAGDDEVERYLREGRRPWSPGYKPYRNAELRRVVHDQHILEAFRAGARLPAGYGRGLDERIVEYPWVLARIPAGPGRLLDAGSTLNYPYLLDLPLLAAKRIAIVTLAPEGQVDRSNVSYRYEDLRGLALDDDAFATIVCISTLEHVGLDNTRHYAVDRRYAEADPSGFEPALRELARVLAPGGRLLLTVPFGRAEHHGWLQQFDADGLAAFGDAFGRPTAEVAFYRYHGGGWQVATAEECAASAYYDVHAGGPAPPDGAAAARAVACLAFVKT